MANVAIEIDTRAKGREISGMVTKGRKVKFWQCRGGLVETQDCINVKVRGDHQSRRVFFSIWHLLGLNIKM